MRWWKTVNCKNCFEGTDTLSSLQPLLSPWITVFHCCLKVAHNAYSEYTYWGQHSWVKLVWGINFHNIPALIDSGTYEKHVSGLFLPDADHRMPVSALSQGKEWATPWKSTTPHSSLWQPALSRCYYWSRTHLSTLLFWVYHSCGNINPKSSGSRLFPGLVSVIPMSSWRYLTLSESPLFCWPVMIWQRSLIEQQVAILFSMLITSCRVLLLVFLSGVLPVY